MTAVVVLYSDSGMDRLAHRVARRHATVVLRDVNGDRARDEDKEIISTCSDGCSVSAEDVERLLGHGGARIDEGSIQLEPNAVGEIEIPFSAVRMDRRAVRSVLRLVARVDEDGSRVTVDAAALARL